MNEKKDLSHLYAALAGITFFVAAIPILDAMSTCIANLFALQSVKINAKVNKISGNSEEAKENTNVIGFQIPTETDGEDVEYE